MPLRGPLAALLLLASLAGTAPARAQDADTLAAQRRIEAAYLFKFGGYISWPDSAFASPDSPVVIGVVGADDMADELQQMAAGRTVNGRAVTVRHLHGGDALNGVQILFVAAGAPGGDAFIGAAHGRSTLAVTEGGDGLEHGADMTFVLVDNRVRFDVSLDTVQQSGLRLSALLLSVAHSVSGGQP